MENRTEQIRAGDARVNEVLSAIDELKSVLSGRNHSFVPYTHTADRKFSKERTECFIQRLLAFVQEKKERENAVFLEEERQVYESYLYCAISYCVCHFQEENMTFETILMMTEDFLLLKFRQMILDQERGELPKDDELERHFMNYSTLFDPDYDFPDFEYDIWYMLNQFLYQEGLTLYGQGEYYLEAMACLRSAAKKLKDLSQRQMRDREHGAV